MEKSFYILNTSRGKIVSNQGLVWGLKNGKVLGAGLDVLENENKQFNKITRDQYLEYLLQDSNVITTPHIAGISKESQKKNI